MSNTTYSEQVQEKVRRQLIDALMDFQRLAFPNGDNSYLHSLGDTFAELDKRISSLERENAAMRAALKEARAQIEYLDGKFQPTGTSAAVLVRIDAALEAK